MTSGDSGPIQSDFFGDVTAPFLTDSDPWWNPMYEVYMMINKEGILFRLESDIMLPLSRGVNDPIDFSGYWGGEVGVEIGSGKRWIPLLDRDMERTRDIDARTYPSILDQFSKELVRSRLGFKYRKNSPEEAEIRELLQVLTPFELEDARFALQERSFTDKGWFREFLLDFADARHNKLYNSETGIYPVELSRGTDKLDPVSLSPNIRVSKIEQLVVNDKILKDSIISVNHPSAGILHFYEAGNNDWRPFDGLAETEDGIPIIDDVRSSIIREMGFGDYITDVQKVLNAQEPTDFQIGGELNITDIDQFNLGETDTKHIPITPDIDRDSLVTKIREMQTQKPRLFAEEVKSNLKNARAIRCLVNNIGNLKPRTIPTLAESLNTNYNILAGHPLLHTDAQRSLFDAVDNRNVRGVTFELEPDPLTGYERPVNYRGEVIPEKAQTPEERKAGRAHWEDKFGRAKSWLENTSAGMEEWANTAKAHRDEFDWMEFESGIRSKKIFGGVSRGDYGERKSGGLINHAPGHEASFTRKALQDYHHGALDDVTVSDLINNLFYEDLPEDSPFSEIWAENGARKYGDLLTADAQRVIDNIYYDDDARLVFNVGLPPLKEGEFYSQEGLNRKLHQDVEDELLGTRWIPTWEERQSLLEQGGFGRIGDRMSDEAYKWRFSDGRLRTSLPPELDDEENDLSVPSAAYILSLLPRDKWKEQEGYAGAGDYLTLDVSPFIMGKALRNVREEEKGLRNELDIEMEWGEYVKVPAHVMALSDSVDQSVIDQLVWDGVLNSAHGSEDASINPDLSALGVKAPKVDSDEAFLLLNIISNRLRLYP